MCHETSLHAGRWPKAGCTLHDFTSDVPFPSRVSLLWGWASLLQSVSDLMQVQACIQLPSLLSSPYAHVALTTYQYTELSCSGQLQTLMPRRNLSIINIRSANSKTSPAQSKFCKMADCGWRSSSCLRIQSVHCAFASSQQHLRHTQTSGLFVAVPTAANIFLQL